MVTTAHRLFECDLSPRCSKTQRKFARASAGVYRSSEQNLALPHRPEHRRRRNKASAAYRGRFCDPLRRRTTRHQPRLSVT